MRRPIADRFWEKVVKSADPNGCWGWTGTTQPFGHGRIAAPGVPAKMLMAHRVSWEIHHGAIPVDLRVLHHCDNPPCTNPRHLFLGTLSDNSRDMVKKGRMKIYQNDITHCRPKGHEYTEANTIRLVRKDGRRHRKCRACEIVRWTKKNRALAKAKACGGAN